MKKIRKILYLFVVVVESTTMVLKKWFCLDMLIFYVLAVGVCSRRILKI